MAGKIRQGLGCGFDVIGCALGLLSEPTAV